MKHIRRRTRKSAMQPGRDYRCVRYEDCLSRAAHIKNGATGFDCSICDKFEMQSESLISLGVQSDFGGYEKHSVGFRRREYAKDL